MRGREAFSVVVEGRERTGAAVCPVRSQPGLFVVVARTATTTANNRAGIAPSANDADGRSPAPPQRQTARCTEGPSPTSGEAGHRGEVVHMSELTIAGIAVALLSAAVLAWMDRAASRVMLTAPGMRWREEMRWGAAWLPWIIFMVCALPASMGLALLESGSEVAVWLIAGAVAALGALMIAQRFTYWQFAGLGMATPEAEERTETGAVNWDVAIELARAREEGWVSRVMLPVTGLVVIAGAIILPLLILPAERELAFAEWLWRVDDEIEFATADLGRPQVWTDIGFEAKTSDRDYKTFADGGRVKLSYFAEGTTSEQVQEAVDLTQKVLAENEAQGKWRITAEPPEGDAIEVVWELEGTRSAR